MWMGNEAMEDRRWERVEKEQIQEEEGNSKSIGWKVQKTQTQVGNGYEQRVRWEQKESRLYSRH